MGCCIVFDTETTGLSKKCRLVSICWEILESSVVVCRQHYFIKPDNFVIPYAAVRIHGITTEMADRKGKSIQYVMSQLAEDIHRYDPTVLVAHNISFDCSVVLEELKRLQRGNVVHAFNTMERFCTMRVAKKKLQLPKNPKLCELYKILTKKDMVGMHDAEADVMACRECYLELCK